MTEVTPYVEADPYAETDRYAEASPRPEADPHLIDTAAAKAVEAPPHGRVSPLSHARR
ncbi:hypothetical protein [Streptomyces sp. NPDC007070]|uniref:hypothetical protein n=1 Tax=Streptomyces sp. NPDC007070 TaxID=3154312 RepID=UPI00340A45F8